MEGEAFAAVSHVTAWFVHTEGAALQIEGLVPGWKHSHVQPWIGKYSLAFVWLYQFYQCLLLSPLHLGVGEELQRSHQ